MRAHLPALLLAAVVAAIVSVLVSTAAGPDELALLREEVRALKIQLAQAAPARREAGPAAATEPGEVSLAASLANLDRAGEEALHAEVTRVIERLEAEKEAAAWEEEMEKRAVEAAASYAEYDEVELNLDDSVSKLSGRLGLASADARDLRSLLRVQNDRNREMTRRWSEGKTSDEELGEVFMANRAAHRAEVRALVGEQGLEAYREFLREGGLGGRFSFFTDPWQDWSPSPPR